MVFHDHKWFKRPFSLLKQTLTPPKETLARKQLKVDFGVVPEINLYQRFHVMLFGNVFFHRVRPPGYSSGVPIHAVNCSRHGLYLDTPHGNSKYFQCPDCLAEVVKEEAEKRNRSNWQ